jgi:hypothetical protein
MMRLTEQIMTPPKEAFPGKKITKKQSRSNIEKRRAKVAARHAKAGKWNEQRRPMFGSGRVRYEVGGNTDLRGRLIRKTLCHAAWPV